MKKNILLSLTCLIMAQMLQAAPVTRRQALRTAEEFLTAANRIKMYSRNIIASTDTADINPYYIFNVAGNGGFVIVAGDDAVSPILGYSYTGSIDAENMPENLKTWLDGYADDIKRIQKSNLPACRKQIKAVEVWDSIPALVSAQWNQKRPFNNKCPLSTNGKSHRPTGCVATAMAQVMYYHKWPVGETAAVKGYSYKDDKMYGGDGSEIVLDDLEPAVFEWDLMQDEYEDGNYSDISADAVAELLKYVGYSVEMMYGVKASAAFSTDIPSALVHTFGYKNTAHIIYRANYKSQVEWDSVIYKELSEGRPVIYSGITKMGSGHQFVCDGYENKYFHINWGWGGVSNGYFKLAVLDPYDQGVGGAGIGSSFSELQTAVIGVRKPIEDDVVRADDISAEPGKTVPLEIMMDNRRKNYTSVQFDLHLPKGIEPAGSDSGTLNVCFNEQRSEHGDHTAGINKISESDYRIVAYSPQNSVITGNTGTLVNIDLNTDTSVPDGSYVAVISNVAICDKDLVTRNLCDTQFVINVKDISGIEDVTLKDKGKSYVYTLEGLRIDRDINKLNKGIYIIDGKKMIVR